MFTPTDGSAEPRIFAGGTSPFVAQLADLADAIRDAAAAAGTAAAKGPPRFALALAARQSADERREVRLRALNLTAAGSHFRFPNR